MDLLSTLLSSFLSGGSVSSLAQASGGSDQQVRSLLSSALPMLLQSMTSNSSTTSGVQSLLTALGQHTSTAPVSQQVQQADTNDGAAIISHILGSQQSSAVNQLSANSGLNTNQVTSILSSIAPALMSGVSAAVSQAQSVSNSSQVQQGGTYSLNGTSQQPAQADNGFDFTDLLGSLMGGSSQQSQGLDIASLLGGNQNSAGMNGASLLSMLLGKK